MSETSAVDGYSSLDVSIFFISDKRSFAAVFMILNFSFSLSVSFLDCSNCFKIFSATERNVTTLRLPLMQVIISISKVTF